MLWVVCVALALFGTYHARGFDDPYITYRYSANIADGIGFVYNAGERVLSTTTPLYALLLVPARLVGLPIPVTSNAIGCLSLALGGWAFWLLGKVWRTPLVGVVGLLLYPLVPLLVAALGGEVCLYNTLVLFGFLCWSRNQYDRAAVLVALATLTRPDGMVAAGCLALATLAGRRDRAVLWRAGVVYGAVLAPWVIFAVAYFGSPFPVTLSAKQHQGMMPISQSFFDGLLAQVGNYWLVPFFHPHLALALVGLCYVLLRGQRPWLLPVGWSLLYAAAYTVLGVTSYFWYYGPVVVGFVALVGLGAAAVAHGVRRMVARRVGVVGVAVVVVLLLVPQVGGVFLVTLPPDPRQHAYEAVGRWLAVHTPPGVSVGTLEVGIMGYYAERRMVDFAGLIQPETARRLGRDTTYQDAAVWAYGRFQPEYVVLHRGEFPLLRRSAAFRGRCERVRRLLFVNRRLDVYACGGGG